MSPARPGQGLALGLAGGLDQLDGLAAFGRLSLPGGAPPSPVATMRALGENMAWLLERLAG